MLCSARLMCRHVSTLERIVGNLAQLFKPARKRLIGVHGQPSLFGDVDEDAVRV
jgi:hypothetical protein